MNLQRTILLFTKVSSTGQCSSPVEILFPDFIIIWWYFFMILSIWSLIMHASSFASKINSILVCLGILTVMLVRVDLTGYPLGVGLRLKVELVQFKVVWVLMGWNCLVDAGWSQAVYVYGLGLLRCFPWHVAWSCVMSFNTFFAVFVVCVAWSLPHCFGW